MQCFQENQWQFYKNVMANNYKRFFFLLNLKKNVVILDCCSRSRGWGRVCLFFSMNLSMLAKTVGLREGFATY